MYNYYYYNYYYYANVLGGPSTLSVCLHSFHTPQRKYLTKTSSNLL